MVNLVNKNENAVLKALDAISGNSDGAYFYHGDETVYTVSVEEGKRAKLKFY